jgi:hypothetical protein
MAMSGPPGGLAVGHAMDSALPRSSASSPASSWAASRIG